MALDMATVASIVSVGTSLGSMAVATAAFRRSSPRLRVARDGFAFRADRINGGQFTIDVGLANAGDKPARVSGVWLVALVPLQRGCAPDDLVELLPGGDELIWPGRRAASTPLGPLRPIRLIARRSTRWQEFHAHLDLPNGKAATTIRPFDGTVFTAPAPWSAARRAHWLRFEVKLVTGEVFHSAWWRNQRDVIESYWSDAANQRSLKRGAQATQRILRNRLRRVYHDDSDQP